MLKDDEIIEKLDEKFKIIQKVGGYKYGEDTILLFKLFQASLNKKNIKKTIFFIVFIRAKLIVLSVKIELLIC